MQRRLVFGIVISMLVAFTYGCAVALRHQLDSQFGTSEVRTRITEAPPGPDFYSEVKPVLDRRCVVCHACYDAPCQLKMSSFEGIDRGANKSEVYDPIRFLEVDPTRLFVDAEHTAGWRSKNFYPVLNERNQTPEANTLASTLYRMLLLKEEHPLPKTKILPESFDFKLDRDQQCPTIEEFEGFSKDFPLWGMPYGLPGLPASEQEILKRWVEAGGLTTAREPLSAEHQQRVELWEEFLNGATMKEQLMSRYLFEHLFLAQLYFSDLDSKESFKIVRSETPPGQAVEIIPTRRPYDAPGVEPFFYRLQRERESISAKIHMPYALNKTRLSRWRELFLAPEYKVKLLPSYEPEVAANPFKAFAAIPMSSKYRFLLDEAEFIVMNFIKGPVCRGQTALNVIEDRFWVLFMNPDLPALEGEGQFLSENSDDLSLPSQEESSTLVVSTWLEYSKLQKKYIEVKQKYVEQVFSKPVSLTMDIVWDGDRNNTNAALTVFRHYDSASVVQGFVGETPKTAWLIGYPLLERIFYLLVSGYDVYGNVGHQLNSRLFMDFLRMEGEYNFLTLLPREAREKERDYWYRGAESHVAEFISWRKDQASNALGIPYRTEQPKKEFFEFAKKRLGKALSPRYRLRTKTSAAAKALSSLVGLRGEGVHYMPELSFLRVSGARKTELFSVTREASYTNVATPFKEGERRRPEEDTLHVATGILGAYPNAFFDVSESALPQFIDSVQNVRSEEDYRALLDAFGIRRSSSEFWSFSDWLHEEYRREAPREVGLLDYNRFENR